MKLIANLANVDAQAKDGCKLPGVLLMDRAAQAVAQQVLSLWATTYSGQYARAKRGVIILCGPGNNGGDGYGCARHLLQAGVDPVFILDWATPQRLSEEARLHEQMLYWWEQQAPSPLRRQQWSADSPELPPDWLEQSTVVVDALFGSGLSRPLEGAVAALFLQLAQWRQAQAHRQIVAVDLPSGIDSLTGERLGASLTADCTVTFATGKPGLYLYPGKSDAGTVSVADIGIPQALIDREPSPYQLLTPSLIAQGLPHRPADAHKYQLGHVLVVAGSFSMPGAAVLSSTAALRAGAGLVTLAMPIAALGQSHLPAEIMRLPLPEIEDCPGVLTPEHIPAILERVESGKVNGLLMGPGLGRHPQTTKAILALLNALKAWNGGAFSGTVVLDGDALWALGTLENPTAQLGNNVVLTPHLGEFNRLVKETASATAPVHRLRQAAERTDALWVLKTAVNLVAQRQLAKELTEPTPNVQITLSPYGNAGMATAGSGDILAGLIAGLCAQSPLLAHRRDYHQTVLAAVGLHGLAGDAAATKQGRRSLVASDLIAQLPEILHRFEPAPSEAKQRTAEIQGS
ncbi:MAG: NAD(P)H-hydrate dehydratase [Candidatus Melainabacteria bacterium]|nr:NAD(P)H-hydrate dehydratase [Candidatus Melainabacteria bacterium]